MAAIFCSFQPGEEGNELLKFLDILFSQEKSLKPGGEAQVFVAAAAEAVVVGVTRGQIVLAYGVRLTFCALVIDSRIAVDFPPLVAVADTELS